MKWSESITLQQPFQDVRLLTQAPALDWEEHLREREKAAYEQGRRDGERALSEQLLQQRNEMVELQNGVAQSIKEIMPRLAHEMESALIQLALESAKKIVGGLPINAEAVEEVVREAWSRSRTRRKSRFSCIPKTSRYCANTSHRCSNGSPDTGPLRFGGLGGSHTRRLHRANAIWADRRVEGNQV